MVLQMVVAVNYGKVRGRLGKSKALEYRIRQGFSVDDNISFVALLMLQSRRALQR